MVVCLYKQSQWAGQDVIGTTHLQRKGEGTNMDDPGNRPRRVSVTLQTFLHVEQGLNIFFPRIRCFPKLNHSKKTEGNVEPQTKHLNNNKVISAILTGRTTSVMIMNVIRPRGMLFKTNCSRPGEDRRYRLYTLRNLACLMRYVHQRAAKTSALKQCAETKDDKRSI